MKILLRVLCCLLVCSPLVSAASDSPSQLVNSLKGKIVFLRGMEAGNNLSFDAEGKLIGVGYAGPFSLSALKVEKVHLSDKELEISGSRVALIFNSPSHSIDDLQFAPINEITDVSIARNPADADGLDAAIHSVFAFSVREALAGGTKEQFEANLNSIGRVGFGDAPPTNRTQTPTLQAGAYTMGQGITPPRLIHSVDPYYTSEMRKNRSEGLCVIHLVVDTNGRPTRMGVQRAPDNDTAVQALATVGQYRFKPAVYQGKPVPVWVDIALNYRLR